MMCILESSPFVHYNELLLKEQRMVTPTQHRIYQFIQDYLRKNGYAPSLIEIARGIGVKSKSLIHRYVHALQEQGMLEFATKGYRRIRLPEAANGIPLLGRIADGKPIEAITNVESVPINEMLIGENRYALQVKGDSMIDEGILDGDIVICDKRDTAREGEIVVALIDQQEATLKKIHFSKDKKIILIPANSSHKPMTYSPTRVQIQGVFMGLLRLPTTSTTIKRNK